jgi:hypothetical protein
MTLRLFRRLLRSDARLRSLTLGELHDLCTHVRPIAPDVLYWRGLAMLDGGDL